MAFDATHTLGIVVELKNGEAVARQLDAIGVAGEKAQARVTQSSGKVTQAVAQQSRATAALVAEQQRLVELGPITSQNEASLIAHFAERKRLTQELIEQQKLWSAESARVKASTQSQAISLKDTETRWKAYTVATGLATEAAKQNIYTTHALVKAHAEAIAMNEHSIYSTRSVVKAHAEALVMNANFGKSAASAGLNVGRLRESMASLVTQTLGTVPVLANFTSILSQMALGGAVTIGVMAGIAAIGYAYNKLTEDSKKAREEHDKQIQTLDDLAKKYRETAASVLQAAIAAERMDLATKQAELKSAQGRASSTGSFIAGGVPAAQVAAIAAEIEKRKAAIAAGEAEVSRIIAEAARDQDKSRVSDLVSLIEHNRATAAERQNAIRLLQGYEQSYAALTRDHPEQQAERAALAERIKGLHDALFPLKELRDATRDYKELVDAVNAAEREQANALTAKASALADAIEKVEQNRAASDLLLAAIKQGPDAYQAQSDALDTLNQLTALGITLTDARYESVKRDIEITHEQTRAIDEQKGVFDRIAKSAADAAEKIKQYQKEFDDGQKAAEEAERKHNEKMQQEWRRGLSDMLTDGLKSWSSFFDSVFGMFRRMMKEMEDTNKTGTLAYKALGLGSAAIGGGFAGYAAGRAAGSAGNGALAGAASGAAAGAAFGPWGAAIGGLAGLTMGLIGGARAARERAEAEHHLQVALYANIEQLKVQLGITNAVNGALAQSHAQFEQLRKQTEEALSGRANEMERNRVLAELTDLERKRNDQLEREAKQIVINDALERARNNQRAGEDYGARIFAASGQGGLADDARFAAAQRREYEEALEAYNAGKISSQTLADLRRALDLEKSQREQEKQSAILEAQRQIQEDTLRQQLDAANEQLKVTTDMARDQESLLNETRRVVDSLQKYGQSLLINPQLSPLNPQAQLEEAGRQLETLFKKALLGDKGAGAQFPDLANSYLGLSHGYNASSQAYVADFQRVQDMTAMLTDQFGYTASIQEQQLLETQKQTAYWQAQIALMSAQLKAVLDSRKTYIVGVPGQDPNFDPTWGGRVTVPYPGSGTAVGGGDSGALNVIAMNTGALITQGAAANKALTLRLDQLSSDMVEVRGELRLGRGAA